MRRLLRRAFIAATAVLALLLAPNIVASFTSTGDSTCYGTTSNGRLENGVALRAPRWMDNVRPYCQLCEAFLRTHVHSKVRDVVYQAYEGVGYAGLQRTDWVYAETGWPWGGSFKPHRTHQNGLSVDFMVPLKDGARFPTHPFNRFGYDVSFDANGRGKAGTIDFPAMARHLDSLDQAARQQGGRIALVVFAPDLQDELFSALSFGESSELKARMRFNRNPSWVRHDDHYHVDFDFPCAPMPSG